MKVVLKIYFMVVKFLCSGLKRTQSESELNSFWIYNVGYWVCRILGLVTYWVCHLMRFVTNRGCLILGFVAYCVCCIMHGAYHIMGFVVYWVCFIIVGAYLFVIFVFIGKSIFAYFKSTAILKTKKKLNQLGVYTV